MTTERLCFFFRILFARARGATSTREPNAKASERAVAKLPAVPRLYHHLSPRVARRRARSILYQQFSFNTTGWIRFQKSRLALLRDDARARSGDEITAFLILITAFRVLVDDTAKHATLWSRDTRAQACLLTV
jgi:hypothetical protein